MTPVEALMIGIVAVLVSTVAGYVHYRLPLYVHGRRRVALTRGVLLLTAIGLGYALARFHSAAYPVPPLLVFVVAFGAVHVPAALILFIKRQRGSGRT
jgi:hypothetical protein